MRKAVGSRGNRRRKPLNKLEQAEIKALSQSGLSNYAIQQRTGIEHNTVKKYLSNQEAYSSPEMQALVEKVLEKEISDLTVLNIRAKARLHDIADRMNPIEALALMDRTFQQRRLLQGKSTENISTLHKIIMEANGDLTPKPKTAAGEAREDI